MEQNTGVTTWQRFWRRLFPPRRKRMIGVMIEQGTSRRWWVCPTCGGAFNPLPGLDVPPPNWPGCQSCQERAAEQKLAHQREAQIRRACLQFDVDVTPAWDKEIVGVKEELQARLAQALDFDLLEALKAHRITMRSTAAKLRADYRKAVERRDGATARERLGEASALEFEVLRLEEIISMDSATLPAEDTIFSLLEMGLGLARGGGS